MDNELHQKLGSVKLRVDSRGYPYYYRYLSLKRKRKVFLHKLVLDAPKGYITDHKDGNRCNVCSSNLRVLTLEQNARNRTKKSNGFSRYKGVFKSNGRFRAVINFGYQKFELGTFGSEEEAAAMYDAAALLLDEAYRRNFSKRDSRVIRMQTLLRQDEELFQAIATARHPERSKLPVGVSRNGMNYQAQIRINGRRAHLGTFSTTHEAEIAYLAAKAMLSDSNTLQIL